ncbi:dolichyl-P-Man:Man(7)GlcNAc(2)-PP-dolichyl-alpha-1,6-mannosyltransferase [Achlya hypogyna]|uniref:Mannosyltransferase n=1 Tax=Achlya hypogyna TaxID=1202772 RepID=A0A1V9YZ50_ACHHY|nr:dolichyl-P-Man:Man(7)GlcNAc(2)-PP-dolichyl-alpha-1,6-mannosyltransferase [Achlya hypogyna]
MADEAVVFAVGAFQIWLSPYAKVEESFNLQAIHDLLYVRNLTAFDHFEFPGVVPRTFIGALPVAALAAPATAVATKAVMQIGARLCLWLLSFTAWCYMKRAVGRVFGRDTAVAFSLVTAVQFHLVFYMSRTLPNIFALALVLLAYTAWIESRPRHVIVLLSFSTVVFRGDTAVLFAPILLTLLVTRQVGFVETIVTGLMSALVSLGLTVGVDSFFWQRWLWPEGEVLWFNTVLNKSHEWGTQPFHWYFTSALPRVLGASALLLPLGLTSLGTLLPNAKSLSSLRAHLSSTSFADRDACYFLLPVVVYVGLFSYLPHKELRFILNAVPIFNLVSAMGVSKLWRSRHKAVWPLLVVLGSLLATALCTVIFTLASHANYPGGEAFSQLHALASFRAHEHVAVHIDVAAAMTGVSRFGEQYPLWTYSKEEDLRDFSAFDYLVTENPERKGFTSVAVVDAFERIDIKGRRLVYRPSIYILQRDTVP